MNDKVLNNVPRELLERVRDLCEYWFTRESRAGMSESEYKTWHALGFGSSAYTELRALLSEQPQASAAQSAPAGEREAFEAWCRNELDVPSTYELSLDDDHIRLLLRGWQAHAAWQRTQSAPVVPEGLNKTREQWQKMDAALCAEFNSQAANLHLLRDAQQDIERLHRALAAQAHPAAHDQGEVQRLREALKCVKQAGFDCGNDGWGVIHLTNDDWQIVLAALAASTGQEVKP